jgi:4-hydroxybutyrate CoA-transferase
MNWQDEYKRKLVSADEAVKIVKSGDTVFSGPPDEPKLLLPALAKRRHELRNVNLVIQAPSIPHDIYQVGYESSFNLIWQNFITPVGRTLVDERRADYVPLLQYQQLTRFEEGPASDLDVFFVVISPPNEHGFCSFGASLWNKKSYCKKAKKVIAEVDAHQIRTGGDNFVHVSQIDYFVEYTPPRILFDDIDEAVSKVAHPDSREVLANFLRSIQPEVRPKALQELSSLTPGEIREYGRFTQVSWKPNDIERAIAENVKSLIKSGQSIQIGWGTPSGTFPACGVFDDKVDLGFWSELACPGIAELIEAGVFTGRYNPHHAGKLVASCFHGLRDTEYPLIDNNPIVEQYEAIYALNPRVIAEIDNFVAINNAISVDLTGQINSETVFGSRLINGLGGQPDVVIGAMLSRGGLSIHCFPSTALGGAVSRIVPQFEEGSLVTIPRYYADRVVTEYGIAELFGKSIRQRADALSGIAHPDFRAELRKAASRLFYP